MNHKGFTIVELLIVIVVIGILASITILSYNGVRAQTENSKTITAAQQTENVLKRIKAEKGNYPSSDDGYGTYSCVGEYTVSICGDAPVGNSPITYIDATVNSSFDALIRQYNRSVLPQPSLNVTTINGQAQSGVFVWLGSNAGTRNRGTDVTIYWVVRDNFGCGIEGSTIADQSSAGKVCSKVIK